MRICMHELASFCLTWRPNIAWTFVHVRMYTDVTFTDVTITLSHLTIFMQDYV